MLSNSTNSGDEYLNHAWSTVEDALGDVKELLFVPYASAHHDHYTASVRDAFAGHSASVRGLHEFSDRSQAIADAAAVFIGGGNTFRLLVLTVTLNDDEASSCLTMGFGGCGRHCDVVVSAVTAGIVVVVTMTAVFGHAGAPRRGLRCARVGAGAGRG